MSEQRISRGTAENDPSTKPPPPTRAGGRLREMTWLLPALTFVVGVVLGGVVVGAITSGEDGAGASVTGAGAAPVDGSPAGATATPSPGSSGDLTVTVPAECAALANDARDAAGLLEQGATAARDLDADALADVARRMQDARDRLAAQADACRGAAPAVSLSSS